MHVGRLAIGIMMGVVVLAGPRWMDTAGAQADAEQSVRGGGVTVTVRFLKQASDGPTFLVLMNTHSVDLDAYRFEDIVRIRDGRGGELAPAAVESTEGGGHHRRATLGFAWPNPKPKTLELVVKGVANVPERVFRWPIE